MAIMSTISILLVLSVFVAVPSGIMAVSTANMTTTTNSSDSIGMANMTTTTNSSDSIGMGSTANDSSAAAPGSTANDSSAATPGSTANDSSSAAPGPNEGTTGPTPTTNAITPTRMCKVCTATSDSDSCSGAITNTSISGACPAGQNNCRTERYMNNTGTWIERTCTSESCTATNQDGPECSTTGSVESCVHCCTSDNCNCMAADASGGKSLVPVRPTLLATVFTTTLILTLSGFD